MTSCPCQSGKPLDDCCGPIIAGAPAPTAEALMRSRFTAYVQDNIDYIESTHDTEVEEEFNRSAAEATAREVEWVGLEIINTTGGGEGDETGTVEFAARFKQKGELNVHHEIGSFRRQDGRWVYVDGVMNPKGQPVTVNKVGRNEPCPCGSGKKYKKCCGA
jgi:SEC-C motif-containing protein